MVVDPYSRTVNRLGQLVGDGTEAASDADLVRRYVAVRDEAAFAALVRRHGPMVFGVCRRALGHVQDAEDAFQATFLVLARKAPAVRPDGLSRWLYGVAVRVANKARVRRARRLAVQSDLDPAAGLAAPPAETPRDWLPLLDTALAKLADRDRRPILLCDLLGRSRAEAAAELGIAEGTLSSRLARAREKLRARLARLGAALSLPALAAGLADEVGATVPSSLIQSTVAAGASPTAARELAEGVLHTMFLAKLFKLSAVGVCLLGALTIGVAWLPTAGADPQAGGKDGPKNGQPAREAPPAASDLDRIQGTWIVDSVKKTGDRKGPDRGRFGGFPGEFDGQSMTFDGNRVECSAFPGFAWTFRLEPSREPKGIDFTFHAVPGGFRGKAGDVTRPSIYRFDADALHLVLGDDDLGERPDSFDPPAGPTPFVHLVLRRPTAEKRAGLERIEQANLQGTWLGVRKTDHGEPSTATGLKLVVKGDRLRLDTSPGESLHATFVLNVAAHPWEMDLTVTGDGGGAKRGEKVPGIIFRHGALLHVSLGSGGTRPRSFEAAGREGTVYTFVREGAGAWAAYASVPEARPSAPKEPAKPENKRLRELQKERVEALKEQLEEQFERVKIGRDPIINVTEAIRELSEAELDLADSREERVAAMERAVKELKLVEKQLMELHQAGLQTKWGVAQAKAARLRAEIQLEKLKLGN